MRQKETKTKSTLDTFPCTATSVEVCFLLKHFYTGKISMACSIIDKQGLHPPPPPGVIYQLTEQDHLYHKNTYYQHKVGSHWEWMLS